ncbi:hypothetical protein DS884_17405 [Tenacibaculum sp. E3R01]|nr:hypothetical protein DS884_17405 [Tenacibaculum sp. E3R01]
MNNKAHVLCVHNGDQMKDKIWLECLQLIPNKYHAEINKFRFWERRQSSLIGKLLLKKALNFFSVDKTLLDIKYTTYKKPYLEDDFSFSISHSGEFVVCAFTPNKEPIGVDIEKIERKIDLNNFSSVLTKREKNSITQSREPITTFYNIWTIKEAVSKADGRGLNLPLNTIDTCQNYISLGTKKWYYKPISVEDNYKCNITTTCKDIEVKLKLTTISELLE